MRIHIEKLELFCIIGLLDFERDREQRVILDILIEYPYTTETTFINYADVHDLLIVHLKKETYLLLETALEGMKELLFVSYPQIQNLTLKITKPDIFNDCSITLSEKWINIPL